MVDCFISYRRTPSAPVATALQAKLESKYGLNVYVDTTRTDGSRVSFPERLMQAIADAPVFVCVLGDRDSEHTLQSEWVLKEIQQAYDLRKFCIPVFQESYQPLPDMPPAVDYLLGFDGVHIFDQKNIMVDESVRQLADLIRPHRKKPFTPLRLVTAFIILIIAVAAVIAFITANTPDSSAQPTLSAEQVRVPIGGSNADWTPYERDFDGVPMMLVGAGCFMMGSNTGEMDERPVHEICFDTPFWIDKYEVTQEQFERLGGQKAQANDFTGEDLPLDSINWYEARDFCQSRDGRLPTEAEWEYAARGPDALVYPWGNTYIASNTIGEDDPTYGNGGPAPVGSRPNGVSWVGALDLSGNQWEWTSSLAEAYPYDQADGRERDTGDNPDVQRVLRGGAWISFIEGYLSAPFRYTDRPASDIHYYGFRCVRDYE